MTSCFVVSLKQGRKYDRRYVETLKSMVARNLTVPHEFLCFSDDGKVPGRKPLPSSLPGWWGKVALFKPGLFPEGSRILFLDLDVVVVGSLDEVFDMKDEFAIIRDWNVPGYNSSAILWTAEARPEIWEEFDSEVTLHLHGDQDWLNTVVPNEKTFPEGWFASYRKDCVAQPKGKVVVFHGEPKPHVYPSEWVRRLWV